MVDPETLAVAADVLHREGFYLDRRDWDAWLALYSGDAEYWVPAWRNEDELVEDPDTEVSMIYHASRVALEERVLRVRSNKSVTTRPLPRTTHFVSNLLVQGGTARDASIEATASWSVHLFHPRSARQDTLFGRYEYGLVQQDGTWRIRRKKIVLMNERIPTLIDFYCL
ncbi:MAG TPA: aromatic-ring-hydroxylating dioxygenase subunit beta [Gammaproteobacteria bacterium]|nr:aromatic-ring-hydroxylating dioxygenase subunit beta [Gammaproteobacteria bacterium]